MNKNITKCILNPAVARFLLREGYTLQDIKPHRADPSRTVFVFDIGEELLEAAIKKYHASKTTEGVGEEPVGEECGEV